jgi:hypothetical protein
MKQIIVFALIMLFGFNNDMMANSIKPSLSKDQLIYSLYKRDIVTRKWESRQLMVLGSVLSLGGLCLENNNLKAALLGIGSASFLFGASEYFLYKTPLEAKYTNYMNSADQNIDLFLKNIINDEKNTRFLLAGITALPLLLNLETTKTYTNSDYNIYWKSLFAGISLMYLLNPTPTEQLCSEILSEQVNKTSFMITPEFNIFDTSLCYMHTINFSL